MGPDIIIELRRESHWDRERDVDEAIDESFPASDPPAYAGGVSRESSQPPCAPPFSEGFPATTAIAGKKGD